MGRSAEAGTEVRFDLDATAFTQFHALTEKAGGPAAMELCFGDIDPVCLPQKLRIADTCLTDRTASDVDCGTFGTRANTQMSLTLTASDPGTAACRCLWKCAAASFFVNKTVDGTTSESIGFSEEHCEAHATTLCQLRGKILNDSTCAPL